MGLSLLDDGVEGCVQLCDPCFGLGGICCLEGLLKGRSQEGLEGLGVGPAVNPGIMPFVGVLYLCRHDVSYWGNRPACDVDWKFCVAQQRRSGIKPIPDTVSLAVS
ncbi:hypothetical protein OLX08_07510 [Nereida ignava]